METIVASLEDLQRDSDTKISSLEEKLLTKVRQLQEAEEEIALMRATIEERDAYAARLSLQATDAQKEAAIAKDKVAKALQEAAFAKEVAKAAKDIASAAADDAQDIGIQAGFKSLRRALLQMAPDFNVDSIDALVTMDVIHATILEAEAEIGPSRAGTSSRGLMVQVGSIRTTPSAAEDFTKVAPAEGNVETMPVEGGTEVAPTEDNAG